MGIKLNVGASPIWIQKGWHIIDHKIKKNEGYNVAGNALNINLEDNSCDIVFCSHVFEHIPHTQLPLVISEFNRVLKPSGLLRLLTPDLEKIATAYANKNEKFFKLLKEEDESIRTDLGLGGMFLNNVVSPGQDTVLLDRTLSNFIAGYAHIYNYDYQMLDIILTKLGFKNRKAKFNDSIIDEMRIPMHITGREKIWNNLNQNFYKKNNLIHKLVDGKYNINFNVSGFDRDPLTSLIIESKKETFVSKKQANDIFNNSDENYNRYSRSLLKDEDFLKRLKELKINY